MLSCFKNRLSIIQGPPGTGKTYIGAHIIKIQLDILERQDEYIMKAGPFRGRIIEKYNPREPPTLRPIFIVCYTNHALDQFLEKIEEYTDSIIRLGGNSKNKQFEDYSLRSKCKEINLKRGRDYYALKD